jgi:hypothetical protein
MFFKPIRLVLLCVLLTVGIFCRAQKITSHSWINLPTDTVLRGKVINSLNAFLAQKEKSNKNNSYASTENFLETSALLDEMKGMEQNAVLKDANYYKCYLTNIVELDPDNFIVQLSYIGLNHNTPILRASFRLMAKRVGDVFNFYSPLIKNTQTWHTQKFGDITFHYKDTLNLPDAKAYQKKVNFYDAKLKAADNPIDYYYCDNFTEVQQLLGIDYKATYNGSRNNSLTADENHANLVVNGDDDKHRFDPHDLWHERLRTVMNVSVINRPVDEGCAYLYGGSWGLSWEEVLVKFKQYATDHQNADWLNLYLTSANYAEGDQSLKIAYALNALIVQKIEREKGFGPVMELLKCGPRQKDDENYFTALKKVTGIDKTNFNTDMWELIKAEK